MKARLVGATLLGAAGVAGFAPFELFPLPILVLAGLICLWRAAESPGQVAALGFAWGLGFFLAGVSWVYVSMHDIGGMAAPLAAMATLVFCAYLALFPALTGWAWSRWRGGRPGGSLLLAALWTLGEWLRGTLLTGFPWLALGYAQTPPSPLAGYAPLLGVYGLSFISAWLAALLAVAGNRRPRLAAALCLLGTGALLRLLPWTVPTGPVLSVSLLQGNIEQSLKWEPERLALSIDTYLDLARTHPARVLVLPETAIPLFLDQVPREVTDTLARGTNVLMGVAVRDGERAANAAVALAPGGAEIGRYAKRHLVPFGEYVPPGFAWFFDLVRIPMSDFSPGSTDQPLLSIAGQQVAVNICYEDLFGEELIAALPRANLLVNLSNTAWFGDSLAQPQHLQIARLRAIETGRPMLRATNTGMTAAIDAEGRVRAQLPPFTRDALTVEVQGRSGMTPYAWLGNAPVLALSAVIGFAAWRGRRRRMR